MRILKIKPARKLLILIAAIYIFLFSAASMSDAFRKLKNHLIYSESDQMLSHMQRVGYNSNWGFSISYNQYKDEFLVVDDEEEFQVYIEANTTEGSMSVGELVIPGESSKEFLISSYICHPSMANDSLSGFLLAAFFAAHILKVKPKYTYRFIWVPETIGAIAYLSHNEKVMKGIDCGMVITTCGGPGNFSVKKSWNDRHFLNDLILDVLRENGIQPDVFDFDIRGSDERQYSSQGFRINTPLLCKK